MIEIVAAHGYEGVTVRGLAKRAHISTGTFYRYYSSTDDCLLCTYDEICGRAARRVREAVQGETEPRQRLVLAIERLFRDMAAAPQVTTFMLRGAPTVGPAFISDLGNSLTQLGAALDSCIRMDEISPPSPLLRQGIVAGLATYGGALVSAPSDHEIRATVAEAVEWIMSLHSAPAPDVEFSCLADAWEQGDSREAFFGDERLMILNATSRIARDGYHELSIQRICREAGVSRREFERHFDDLGHCFASALEEQVTAVMTAWKRKGTASTPWSRTVYEMLWALCDWCESDRDSARVLLCDITAADTRGVACRDRLISQIARALRAAAPDHQAPSEMATEASTAAAWAVLCLCIQEDTPAIEAVPALVHLLLVPEDRKHTAKDEKPLDALLDFS